MIGPRSWPPTPANYTANEKISMSTMITQILGTATKAMTRNIGQELTSYAAR